MNIMFYAVVCYTYAKDKRCLRAVFTGLKQTENWPKTPNLHAWIH